jgi:hypothetical protein
MYMQSTGLYRSYKAGPIGVKQWTLPCPVEFHFVCPHACRCVWERSEHRRFFLVSQTASLITLHLRFPSLLHFTGSLFYPSPSPNCFLFTGAKTLKCLSKTVSSNFRINSFCMGLCKLDPTISNAFLVNKLREQNFTLKFPFISDGTASFT